MDIALAQAIVDAQQDLLRKQTQTFLQELPNTLQQLESFGSRAFVIQSPDQVLALFQQQVIIAKILMLIEVNKPHPRLAFCLVLCN